MTTPISKRIPDLSAEDPHAKRQRQGETQDLASNSSVFLNPLPAEIIFKVFNHLTFQDCLSLRLVCTQAQNLADTYVISVAEKFAAYNSHPEDPKNAAHAFRCLSRVYAAMLTLWKPEAFSKTPCASLNWNHLSFESMQLLMKLKSRLPGLNGELQWDTLEKSFGDFYPLAIKAFGPLISKYLREMPIKIPPSVLVKAATIDDQGLLQVLIDAKVDVNLQDDAKVDVNLQDEVPKRTPLCAAIVPEAFFEQHGYIRVSPPNVACVMRLIEAGADITQTSELEFEWNGISAETPLAHALFAQEPFILQIFLDTLKNKGQLESFVNTPIRTVLYYDCFSPICEERNYFSPLELCIVACMSISTLKMMEMLIQAGADPAQIDSKGRTLLHVFWGVKSFLKCQEEESTHIKSNANRLGSELFLAIPHLILREWRMRGVLHLLNHRSQEGRVPLLEASLHGDSAGIELLLEAGANPTASDICDLVVQGDEKDEQAGSGFLSTLAAKGFSLNQPRKDGLTPLMLALGKPNFFLTLVRLGADPTRSISGKGYDIQPAMREKTILQILFEHLEYFKDRHPQWNRNEEKVYLELLSLILPMTKNQLLGHAPDGRPMMSIARKMNLPSAVLLVEKAYASLALQEKSLNK